MRTWLTNFSSEPNQFIGHYTELWIHSICIPSLKFWGPSPKSKSYYYYCCCFSTFVLFYTCKVQHNHFSSILSSGAQPPFTAEARNRRKLGKYIDIAEAWYYIIIDPSTYPYHPKGGRDWPDIHMRFQIFKEERNGEWGRWIFSMKWLRVRWKVGLRVWESQRSITQPLGCGSGAAMGGKYKGTKWLLSGKDFFLSGFLWALTFRPETAPYQTSKPLEGLTLVAW